MIYGAREGGEEACRWRVYDYWLGGKDNFEADRIAGEETIAAYPAIRASAQANRAFLARTVSTTVAKTS